jgi:hypothetical protein
MTSKGLRILLRAMAKTWDRCQHGPHADYDYYVYYWQGYYKLEQFILLQITGETA